MNPLNSLFTKPKNIIGLRMLRLSIGVLVLFRIFTEIPYAIYFWGPSGIGEGTTTTIFGQYVGSCLDLVFANMYILYLFIALMGMAAFGFVVNKFTFLSNIVLLITFWSLEQRFYLLGDGGDNITRLALLYLMFTNFKFKENEKHTLKIWVHNTAVFALILQIGNVYFVSGLMKAWGDKWVHGVALYHISQVDWFSMPFFNDVFKNPLVTTFGSYFTLFYQLSFPIAIFSKFRLAWIVLGVFFHLNIAIVMGLITFSVVMIGFEFFLIKDDEYHRIEEKAKALKDYIHLKIISYAFSR